MKEPVEMSATQLTAYRSAIQNVPDNQLVIASVAPPGVAAGWNTAFGQNNRPVKPIGTRTVQLYTDEVAAAEEAAEESSNTLTTILIVGGLCLIALIGFVAMMVFSKSPSGDEKTSLVEEGLEEYPPDSDEGEETIE